MDDLDRVTRAKEAAEARLLGIPGVTGVGVGYKVTGGVRTETPAIIVFVQVKRDDPEEPIPPEIDGVATDVQERTFVLHQSESVEREREGADGGPAGRSTEGEGGAAR